MGIESILGAVAGPVIGGLFGASESSSGGGAQQTATKEPWAEAAPWLKNQITQGRQLQDYYQQNPFNAQQQTAYNNTFADLDTFRNQTAPSLMNFANNAMTGSYQRQPPAKVGLGYNPGATGHERGNQTPGGLLGGGDQSIDGLYKKYLGRAPEAAGAQYWQQQFGDSIDPGEVAQFQRAAQPEMMRNGGQRAAPFQAPAGLLGGSYGQVNAGAQNPFTNGAVTAQAAQAAPSQKTVEQMVAEAMAGQNTGWPVGDRYSGGSA